MKQLALYGLNGIANTVVGYVVFFVLAQVIDYRLAIVVGYLVAMLVSYALNSRVVFQGPGRPGRFIILNLLLMGANVLITWTIVETASIEEEFAQLIAIPIVFLAGFTLNKTLVFDRTAR